MVSIGRTREAAIACLSSARGTSAATTPRRKRSPSSRAISRMMESVSSRCGRAPAEPAEPTMSGMSRRRAARSTLRKSRFAPTRVGAILPPPR
jgi:hypothetical protein